MSQANDQSDVKSPERLAVLGSTGSVGCSTLDVVRLHPERYTVEVLTANTQIAALREQIKEFRPSFAVVCDKDSAQLLQQEFVDNRITTILVGSDSLSEVVALDSVDCVMAAIVGAAGLPSALKAVEHGKKVLIANKEPLVMTGNLFTHTAAQSGATILPIDSEHNAIFQCLPHDQSNRDVARIHLTASGGPFLGKAWAELSQITPDQACAHPNWSMGRKISVDSATMMNKGLELIEATALFGLPASQVEVLVHPQSIIHSLVEYVDGSFLAQLGAPDMRIPIAHALAWPDRVASGAAVLDLAAMSRLDFQAPDLDNIPCLALALAAASEGGKAPIALNAANELAVEAFLQEKIRFTDIPKVIDRAINTVLADGSNSTPDSLNDVLNIDNEVRMRVRAELSSAS